MARVEEIEEVDTLKNVQKWEKVLEAREATEAVRIDEKTREKTTNAALSAISTIDRPGFETIHPARVRSVDSLSNEEVVAQSFNKFPHLALEVIKAGLAKEELYNKELDQHIAYAEKLHNEVDQLIALNRTISGLKGDDLFDQIKSKDLLTALNIQLSEKTTVAEARVHFDSLISSKRSELSSYTAGKINPTLQNMQAIIDILRDVLRKQEKLNDAIQAITKR